MEKLALQALDKLAESLDKETTAEKITALMESQSFIFNYLLASGKFNIITLPNNTSALVKYLKSVTLGEFVPEIAREYANERVFTADGEDVSEAVKNIIKTKKETA